MRLIAAAHLLLLAMILPKAENVNHIPSLAAQQQTPSPTGAEPRELAEAKRLNASILTLYANGNYDEALEAAKQTLKAVEKLEGINSKWYGEVLLNLASIYAQKSDNDEATVNFRKSLSILEKVLGPDDPELLPALSRSADVHVMRREYGKAEPLLKRAIAIQESVSGAESKDSAELMLRYSCVLRPQRKTADAEQMESRAGNILYKLAGGSVDTLFLPGACANFKAFEKPAPAYPQEAMDARASGTVYIEVTVDESGKVTAAHAVNGHPALRKVSEAAAFKAKFVQTIIGGKPVKLKGYVTYNYTLRP